MKKLSVLSMLLAIAIGCSASTITVNWDGSGDYTTIQAGINAAVSGTDTVIVAEGTYDENINFGGKNLVLTSTDPNDPAVVEGTVIDGGQNNSTVRFSGAENNSCLLTGFTITGGSKVQGGGINGNGATASIISCVITGNTAGMGGGAYLCYGVIKNCVISENEASQWGGGLAECNNGTISDCIITDNYAGIDGGGLWSCSADITNCLVTNNVAEWIGGGGHSCSGPMTNSTICDNTTVQGIVGGAGLALHTGSVTNCIFWGNTDALGSLNEEKQLEAAGSVDYSCIQNCSLYYSFGTGNISDDPTFVTGALGDYYLSQTAAGQGSDSPCVDAGSDTSANLGMDGYTTRTDQVTDGGTVDMGFHYAELTSPYIGLSASEFVFAADFNGPNPDDQILTIRNFSVGTLNWEISEACSWLTAIPISGNSSGEPNDVVLSVDITSLSWGQYNCQLTVSDPCAYNNPQVVSVNLNISRRIYVDASASAGGNGQTWPTAYKYLRDALGERPAYGDEIWVAEGIYRPDEDANSPSGTGLRTDTYGLRSGVMMYGGFRPGGGTWEERDPNRYESILSGDLNDNDAEVSDPWDLLSESTRSENSYHVVTGSGTDLNTILDGFTISGGNAKENNKKQGGGMYNYSGSPTVSNCTFTNNSADHDGGGMYNTEYSSPKIENCSFIANSARDGGGGVCNEENSNPTIEDCLFTNNVASDEFGGGGGIINQSDSSPTLKNCTFIGNRSGSKGGGICNHLGSTKVIDCTFIANTAMYYGGGMSNTDNNPIVINCKFVGNISTFSCGGGIFNSTTASPEVTNCIFSGNSAGWGGGGMHNDGSVNSVLTNCTFSSNTAVDFGGGIANWNNSDLTLTNCIVWGNTAITGQQIHVDGTSLETVNYSDVQGSWAGTGNIDEDPLFKDSNGPDAIAGTEDDNLEPGYDSPCIDSGDSNSVPADIADLDDDDDTTERTPLDLAGRERFTDEPMVGDTGIGTPPIVDMGAYERYQFCGDPQHPYPTADMNDDCVVNFEEVLIMALAWLSEDGEGAWNPDCDISTPADGLISLPDLGVLGQHWQESTNPE
jgi:hypothetical protein